MIQVVLSKIQTKMLYRYYFFQTYFEWNTEKNKNNTNKKQQQQKKTKNKNKSNNKRNKQKTTTKTTITKTNQTIDNVWTLEVNMYV